MSDRCTNSRETHTLIVAGASLVQSDARDRFVELVSADRLAICARRTRDRRNLRVRQTRRYAR